MKWKNSFRLIFVGGFLLFGGTARIVTADPSPSSNAGQKSYVRRAQAQIDALTAGLHKAERKMAHLDSSVRAEAQETLRHLWQKERLARVRLKAIQKAAPTDWQRMRKSEDVVLVGLQKSYQHFINRYFR